MTPEEKKKQQKKHRRIALIVGVVLALICKSLPPEYHAACDTIAGICRGGF